MQTPPSPYRGEIGNHNGTLHNPWRPYGQSKLSDSRHLEIPAEIAFIHPLEARENWTKTGLQFVLGDTITITEGKSIFGVVHGFVTQLDSSSLVLIWFNETVKYQQLRPDQI